MGVALMSETWGSKYLKGLRGGLALCGTCGSPLMPIGKMLDAFYDWLKKQGVVLPPEKRWKAENYDKLEAKVKLLEENLENLSALVAPKKEEQ